MTEAQRRALRPSTPWCWQVTHTLTNPYDVGKSTMRASLTRPRCGTRAHAPAERATHSHATQRNPANQRVSATLRRPRAAVRDARTPTSPRPRSRYHPLRAPTLRRPRSRHPSTPVPRGAQSIHSDFDATASAERNCASPSLSHSVVDAAGVTEQRPPRVISLCPLSPSRLALPSPPPSPLGGRGRGGWGWGGPEGPGNHLPLPSSLCPPPSRSPPLSCSAPRYTARYMVTTHAPPRPRLCWSAMRALST